MKLHITQGGKPVDLNSLASGSGNNALTPLFSSAEHHKAMDKIHSLVCVRERTQKECFDRLLDDGFDYATVQEAVDAAVRCGLIDEKRYASAFIRGKTHLGWGKGKIIRRLREDNVAWSIIDSCSDCFATAEEEYQRALEELSKRPAKSKNPRATLTRRLLQKGYSQDLVYRAVSEFMTQSS